MERTERIDTPTVLKIKNRNAYLNDISVKDSLTPEGQGHNIGNDLCPKSPSRSRTPGVESCRDENDTNYDGCTIIFDNDDEDEDLYGSHRKKDFSVGVPPDSYEAYMVNGRYAFERKERQRRVMRQILSTFDLEKVKDRYRGATINESLSHADRRFREWLETAMGNDKVDLCDRKWNERFREKVMEEYQRQQILREKQLAEAEVRRIHKLRLQGILSDEGDEDEMRRSKRSGSQKRGKKKSDKYLENRTSKHQSLYIRPNDDVETQMQGLKKQSDEENDLADGEQGEDGIQEQKSQDTQDNESQDGQSDRLPMDENDQETQLEPNASSDSGNSDLESRMICSYKSQLGRAHMGQESHIELQRLYDLEDLRELYLEAETLVQLSRKK